MEMICCKNWHNPEHEMYYLWEAFGSIFQKKKKKIIIKMLSMSLSVSST